jgi:hypothetical protein
VRREQVSTMWEALCYLDPRGMTSIPSATERQQPTLTREENEEAVLYECLVVDEQTSCPQIIDGKSLEPSVRVKP